ncbi:MAG TPA: hypothetical protein VHI55_09945, partial [Gaiellaceae bacterium]|nr:hypothetical protein [Gaiellaceae bacterium]
GTDVNEFNVDLAGSLGGATGDGAADRVIVNGTNGDDTIAVSGGIGGGRRARPLGQGMRGASVPGAPQKLCQPI